jgi:Ca-activated chloride channel family protein
MGGVAAPSGLRRKQSIARPSQAPQASLSDLEQDWSTTDGWLDDFFLAGFPVEEVALEENRAGFARVSDINAEVSEGEEVELISPSPANWEQGTPVHRLQVIQVIGLDQRAIALLTQHLQSVQLPTGFSGDLVFEFRVHKGRVKQVVLDEQASSLTEQTVIDEIRKLLLIWRSPTTIIGNVQIVLRVE